jgi:hypothetical protein
VLHFNSNGTSLLTAADRASLERGIEPSDGSGRQFRIVDATRLVMLAPGELEPIELGWIDDVLPDELAGQELEPDADGIADRDRIIGELRAQLADANETIGRVMAQRDQAIADVHALMLAPGATADREEHADLLGDPATGD